MWAPPHEILKVCLTTLLFCMKWLKYRNEKVIAQRKVRSYDLRDILQISLLILSKIEPIN